MKKTILSLLVALMATTGATAQIAVSGEGNTRTFTMPAYDVEVTTELWYKLRADGTTPDGNKTKANVFLDRTLQAKGNESNAWSTFCAPFNAAIPDGWTVMELSSTAFSAGTLTLTFSNASSIVAGTPYLVQVDAEVVDPTFEGVSQDWSAYHEVTATGGYVTFVPVLTPTTLDANDRYKLYLGGTNSLYYPSQNVTVNGFRAYFKLNGITAGDLPNNAHAFVLNLGDDVTGIDATLVNSEKVNSDVYDLQGRKLQNVTRKGVYIVNGKKRVIK
jgi:hypothetical protein